MLNISFVGNLPSLAKKIGVTNEPPYFVEIYNEVVDSALRSELTDYEFHSVVHEHRRSPWNEDAFNADIDALDCPDHPVPKDDHYRHAFDYIQRKFFTPEVLLRPVHFTDLRQYPWELSTSIGAPYATSEKWKEYVEQKFSQLSSDPEKKEFSFPEYRDLFAEAHHGIPLEPTMVDARMTKRNLYNEAFFINRKHVHIIKDGKTTNTNGHDLRYWNTAFARQYLVKEDDLDKVRLVFGAPWLLLMIEAMFFWPLQAWLLAQGTKSPMLWGFETLIGGWYRLVNWFTSVALRALTILTLDWSKFDRYARHTVLKDIQTDILRPMFDFTNGYQPTHDFPRTTADSQRLENLWNWMCDAVLTTPLLLNDGRLLKFNHSGIFSGYLQTQLMDTIYNMVMIYTILFRLGFTEEQINAKFEGDDSVVSLTALFGLISFWILDQISHYAQYYFGAILSVKKSEVLPSLQHAEVLKYRNNNGMPYREPLMLLSQLRYPERGHSLETLKARAVGIAYANVGSDPRVYRICEQIFTQLDKRGIKANAQGLPDQIQFMNKFLRLKSHIDVDVFPSYYDTVKHLMDPPSVVPTEKYWPRSHFTGIPGMSQK
nr:MAG: RNA-dependent RNA polymerase [Flammulina alphapartitivirus 1]